MRRSIFTRPLEGIPEFWNPFLVLNCIFLFGFGLFCRFPWLFEPENCAKIQSAIARWGLVFGVGLGGMSALICFVFAFLPDRQTRSGHRGCILCLAGAAFVAALVATGLCVAKVL
jgi:hypothetical protein